jgi:hypothetical protein
VNASLLGILVLLAAPLGAAEAAPRGLIPPIDAIKPDRPRVFLRPRATPHAISLAELRAVPRDDDCRKLVERLRGEDDAAAQALLWLLEGDPRAAEAAIARMRSYEFPGEVDTFHIYFKLLELGLAYDWLHGHEGFTEAVRAEVRARALPLARHGLEVANDHMFHNYIWMSAGGVAIWALATAGEDGASDEVFERVRRRFNEGLYPAWRYLDGLPSEPMGYWALYVLSPGVQVLLGAQSAFEEDLVARMRADGGWLDRHFENLIQSTLPDMRYIPWGDLQGGPNGGVTHEMAGIVDAATWALRSPHGAYFSDWIARKRGLARYHGATAIYFLLYGQRLRVEPATPPLGFRAGAGHGGHFVARSGWDDEATVVALTATDHFGDHHHYDQGSFTIYRNGLLAVDPPVYRRVAGPQQRTDNHSTLLFANEGQRRVRGQWFVTVEDFKRNLTEGRKLETGDFLWSGEGGSSPQESWAAASVEFAQAYSPDVVRSCVRQLLFVRPGTVLVVDRIAAPEGKSLPEVSWLLQVPPAPSVREGPRGWTVEATNGRSWIQCRPVLSGASPALDRPKVEETDVGTHRVSYAYAGAPSLVLAHMLEVGDGEKAPAPQAPVDARWTDAGLEVTFGARAFLFAAGPPYGVRAR